MNKEERKQRFALTLLVATLVFVIISVTAAVSIAIIYFLLRAGIIDSVDGRPKPGIIFIFMSLISMVMGFIITMFAGKILLKPFNRIINKLNCLAKGDFNARLQFGKPICDHPTFREIQNSFNRAAEELQHTQVLSGDFINNFSHEFKTPIVSIAGFAKLLRHGNLTEEQRQEYLAAIEEESLRLSYLATNVLNLTKVENHTILTNVSKFNLSEQLRGAVLLFADKWSQKNLEMDIEFGEHLIYANEELLKMVWINLLDNAVKFSDPGGKVTVKITEGEKDIYVAVSNNGREIPLDSRTLIFNKFYQADESHSSNGSGIGLAIVKKVVDLHRGEVFAQSGGGTTTFTVKLPRKQD